LDQKTELLFYIWKKILQIFRQFEMTIATNVIELFWDINGNVNAIFFGESYGVFNGEKYVE
jgi:hypothetical protein